jgi:hypothetical protein
MLTDKNLLLRSICAIVLLASAAAGQGIFFAREPSYATAQEASEAEEYLKFHSQDRTVVKRLLDYYVQRWQNTQADRLRVVLWAIENHPGIDLGGAFDSRGLLLNPDDREGYQKARQLWLEQVRRYPGDPRVLENAAVCLKLTDRESAADWLKQAMVLNPARRGSILMEIADVYAAAIAGVSGASPWEGPTSVDPAESGSSFAKQALLAAAQDAELAGRTGWALYLTTEAFHRLNVSDADYDSLAEELLLKSAALDFPEPARLAFLGVFYERQERMHSGRIRPKSRRQVVAADEQRKRLLSKTTSIGVTGENTATGPVHVVVDVIVGTDGHVWKAVPKNAPSELIGSAASAAVKSWIYRPLESQGEPVRVATTVDITVDVRP